ncbi:MAG: hypothetical protein K8T10_16940 [Candidatus Eremiobacteraeota bacterium]|nr:hypothetical protein [Candidatus Eremiobacteraeota bacterium]
MKSKYKYQSDKKKSQKSNVKKWDLINLKFMDSRKKIIKVPDGTKLTIWETTDKSLKEKNILASTYETALVAMTYIKHYEIFKNEKSLKNALAAYNFLYHMQGDNGCFYKYLGKNGNIIKEKPLAGCNLEEHTAYAFMALAEGSRVLRKSRPGDYNQLEDSFLQVFSNIKKIVQNPDSGFGNYVKYQKMKIPAWLILGRGDLSAMYLIGMSKFYDGAEYHVLGRVAKELGQGIMEFKNIEKDRFPQYAHLTYSDLPTIWKTANAFQTAALAFGGKSFKRNIWIKEAEKEGTGFLMHLVTSYGPIEGFYPHPDLFPQSPIGAYTLTENFNALYRVTGDEKFAKVAGICAAWFFHNNPTKKPVYFPVDGSCYTKIFKDGVNDTKSLMGTAAALLSLMAVYDTPGQDYLSCKPEYTHAFAVLESEEGRAVNEDFEVKEWEYSHDSKGKVVIIRRKNTFWHKFTVDREDDYFMLLSFQKQLLYSSAVAVNVRIDGGPILLVPLGGAVGEPFMLMKTVIEPVKLKPGYHTVGVRYRGLLLTLPAIIDCSVLQPVLQRKKFTSETGKNILLVKNWATDKKKMHLPKDMDKKKIKVDVRSIGGHNLDKPIKTEKDKRYFYIPAEGFGIMEW